MVIITAHLDNIAKAMAGEGFTNPNDLIVAIGDNSNIGVDDNALDGEIGTRLSFTKIRSDNTVNFTAVRSGTDVVDTINGDSLTGSGMDIAPTNDNMQVGVEISELQTTAFDLEFNFEITYDRA